MAAERRITSLAKHENPARACNPGGFSLDYPTTGPARREVWAQCALARAHKAAPPARAGGIGTPCQFSWLLSSGTETAMLSGMPEGGKGEARMRMFMRDIMLFSCLVAFVAGLVIAAATLFI